MAFWCDNIHTTVFTPRDFQVELLAAAYERNVCICLGHKSSKEFIAMKLLQEHGKLSRKQQKINLYITRNSGQSMCTMLENLTDLKVYQQCEAEKTFDLWLPGYEVYIVHPQSCLAALRSGNLKLDGVHLMILEDCHELEMHQEVLPIFKEFFADDHHDPPMEKSTMPRVLSLAGPLHSAGCMLEELSAMLDTLEKNVHCKTETASDIVTVLRYCSKPIELIVQCAPHTKDELTLLLEEIIVTRKAFLSDHRYDPTEIYSMDEFMDELKDIPDPKKEPVEFLDTMLTVLHEMGPWSADRVAVNMFHRIEKQKIKTPHERHYLLLCLVNTALSEIHAICEHHFRKFTDHKELVERYSSTKVLRLLEVLRQFRPEDFTTENETIKRFNQDLERMDFQKLSRTIEYSCQNVESISKQQNRSILENLDPLVRSPAMAARESAPPPPSESSKNDSPYKELKRPEHQGPVHGNRRHHHHGGGSHGGHRLKRRPYTRRQKLHANGDSLDTLCALIFCNSSYTARVLFDLLTEMSRHDAELKFLKCQFTTDRMADPLTEPKEAEAEHRRQEEVLKRFRMHDCNVLIGTAVLEEGIDVPKCNLVLRWDPPTTYRSYVQCKGRARASNAYHVTLVAPSLADGVAAGMGAPASEQLSDRGHRFICKLDAGQDDTLSDGGEESSEDDQRLAGKAGRFVYGSAKGIVKILNPEVITNKPPTATEISLKEIEDEESLRAIEAPKVEEVEKQLEKTEEPPLNGEIALPAEPKNGYNLHKVDLSLNVADLNELIANMSITTPNSSMNESTAALPESNNSSSSPPQPAVKRERGRFQCQAAVEESQTACVVFQNEVEQVKRTTRGIVDELAHYREIEKMLLRKCANTEPAEPEHLLADEFTGLLEPYKPQPQLLTGASVDLSTAIALINKYCSKLPSDTFTKLTALWRCTKTKREGVEVFQYTLRLPINSPLKYDILGLPMSSHILARRLAALQGCMALHRSGELDDNLNPIGKEGFRAIESDWESFELELQDEKIVLENSEPRPGTTKRRQYYYKRIASELCHCRPTAAEPCFLYLLDLTLQCPIPEEQNTRGRKIYPPEEAQQGFGILTLKKIPKVSSFPIFTRSGEVKVSIELAKETIVLNEAQIRCINTFVNYTFTNVLRLQKFLMLFDPESTENCVFIVPTLKTAAGRHIDWQFLELIERNANMMPTPVVEERRSTLEFDANKFRDAVIMPWYRNQDQPQYFYVAEICPQLSPLSCFPGENYRTFQHYYFLKYGLNIQNSKQPLLDVDHTSARLNFLTPRYVNRKGVALPTSSEETKRAKRENLEQKQILVPELCTVHPFPASLWRTAVCLPCILYRINGLLLADDIRKKVSADIALGAQEIAEEFEWPMLDFGWSLSEVLKKSREHTTATTPEAGEDGEAVAQEALEGNKQKGAGENGASSAEEGREKSANEIVSEAEKKLKDSSFIEIGTWSNDMAKDLELNSGDDDDDELEDEEFMKYLPPNVSFCDQQVRYGSPTSWDVREPNKPPAVRKTTTNGVAAAESSPDSVAAIAAVVSSSACSADKSNFTSPQSQEAKNSYMYYDSDDSFGSSNDGGGGAGLFGGAGALAGLTYSSDEDDDDESGPLRIAFTSKNEAETIETEQEIEKRQKQLSIIQATTANERAYQETKNLQVGYNFVHLREEIESQLRASVAAFKTSTEALKAEISSSGMLVHYSAPVVLHQRMIAAAAAAASAAAVTVTASLPPDPTFSRQRLHELCLRMLPYANPDLVKVFLRAHDGRLSVADVAKLNNAYVSAHPDERFTVVGSGHVFDNFNDKQQLEAPREHEPYHLRIDFEAEQAGKKQLQSTEAETTTSSDECVKDATVQDEGKFSFDHQPDLVGHPGPSPSIILQALTMSNANDGINLERLETIGDSFLKYAITTYLYITYENVHEGKLSHLRSKQVANLNLYRLGRRKMLGEYMIATKFEPHDNWLPPCYYVPKELEKALIEAKIPPRHWKLVDLQNIKKLTSGEICALVRENADKLGLFNDESSFGADDTPAGADNGVVEEAVEGQDFTCFIPYNLVTQHSIPDKSIADCVEALIGAYLIECGPRGALLFMAWLGIRVLPYTRRPPEGDGPRMAGSTRPDSKGLVTVYGEWTPPKSPLLHYARDATTELDLMLEGFEEFEATLGYRFRDRSYLLQAMTHASYSPNRLTDCYQRLEFLGDAVLDYLITRHLYEDPRQHSPGALTDLRSALVNNTIFASLAVRHGFHKYFRHLSPGLNEVIDRFVRIQQENGHSISEEYYLLSEEECDDAEDVEVPKALGDVFESVAGAIFLDSNMSLDVVWQVYSNMMRPEIEQFSNSVPKSPIRELLELEPETAKFGKPEKLADGRRVRVTVDVFCKGTFRGIGRNYRIAKCTAAKCALRQLKKQGLISKKD